MFTTFKRWLRAWAAPAIFSFVAACGGGNNNGGNQAVAPSITTQPAAATATEGEPATFSVVASGTAPLAYQWQRNGTAIAGATTASYTTPALALADDGAQYSVVVSNSAGSVTSSTALLTALATLPPTIVAQPSAVSVVAPASATFSVSAQGNSLTYQWTRNGTPISGATSASYTTPATALADSGALFAVTVSNPRGDTASDEASLTVTAVAQPPAIATQPSGATVASGETATFSVAATGTAPLAYQWRRNGAAIADANGASYTTPTTVDGDDRAAYSVIIDNVTAKPVTSAAASLRVIPVIAPPSISAQPAAQSVIAGQTATFSVAANGTPPLAYQWRRNGTAIVGPTAASYTTPATVIGDDGARFSVVVSNASPTAATSADAQLSVTAAVEPPSIVAQPADATVSVGASATFTAGATGSAPLAYQWRRNGVAIGGASAASYTIASATLADHNALFDVVVSNAAPTSATSNSARLTVLDQWIGIREDGAIGSVHDGALAVAADPAGNVVIGGRTAGLFEGPENRRATNPFIAKYSAGGVRLWARQVFDHGGLGGDYAIRGVDTDSAGNIYGVGDTVGALPGNVNAGSTDVIVVKYDPDGNVLWLRQFGSSREDRGNAIAVDAAGNAYIVGDTSGQLPDQAPNRGRDFYIAKFDAQGNRLWIRESGTSSGTSDGANGVAVDAAGNAYMTGMVGHDYGSSPRRNGYTDAYVAKYDAAGNQLWFSRIAGEHGDEAFAIAVAASGNTIYLAGQTNSNFDLPSYPTQASPCCAFDDAFVVSLDGSGAIRWATNLSSLTLEGPRYFRDEARGIATNADGSQVYVTGFTLGVMPGDTSKGAQDIFVARYEGNGTRSWVKQFGGALAAGSTHPDAGYGITLDAAGDVFVAGEVIGDLGTPNPNRNHIDWFVMKLRAADGSAY